MITADEQASSHAHRAAPTAIIDVLNGLLEPTVNSVFRFMGEGSPYLGRATAEVRRPLEQMVGTVHRRAAELALMIEQLGGTPVAPRISGEEQYLAFLSLKFLLPKLVHEKQLAIERYENALRALTGAPAEVTDLLRAHLAEHQAQLRTLEEAAARVAAGK